MGGTLAVLCVGCTSASSEVEADGVARARTALAEGRYEEAEHWARASLDDPVVGIEARGTLATALREQGRLREALETLDEPPDAAPSALLDGERGAVYRELGLFAAALEVIERRLEASPDDAQLLHEWGELLAELGRPEDAIAAFAAAVRSSPDSWRPWAGALALAIRLGARDDGIRALLDSEFEAGTADALLERMPADVRDHPEILFREALLRESQNDRERARNVYRNLLERVPEHATAWTNLALIEEARGANAEAHEALGRAAALTEDPARLTLLRARMRQLESSIASGPSADEG